MTGPARRQRGVTLLISLIMLTILTLFASAMIRLSSTNMLIAGNMAVQHSLRDVVQRAIETDLSSSAFYNDVVNSANCWTGNPQSVVYGSTNCFNGANTNGYVVTLWRPYCLVEQPAAGYSALINDQGTGVEDTYWEVSATGVDTATGASVTLTQGVKITIGAGNCNGS